MHRRACKFDPPSHGPQFWYICQFKIFCKELLPTSYFWVGVCPAGPKIELGVLKDKFFNFFTFFQVML